MVYSSIEEKMSTLSERAIASIKKRKVVKDDSWVRIPDEIELKINKLGASFVKKAKRLGLGWLNRLFVKNTELRDYVYSDRTDGYKKTNDLKKGSPGEILISRRLNGMGIVFERERNLPGLINPKTGQKLFFDFFIPKLNCCIEFDGKQHFVENTRYKNRVNSKTTLSNQRYRDKIKNDYCVRNGIVLIRIPYYQYMNIDAILYNFFGNKSVPINYISNDLNKSIDDFDYDLMRKVAAG